MALDSTALLTLAEAKDALRVTGSSEDVLLERAVNVATLWAEHVCERRLKSRAVTSLRLAGPPGRRLYLPIVPISTTATLTVTHNGDAQTVWKVEADGDPEDFDVIVGPLTVPSSRMQPDYLYRSAGWSTSSWANPYNVLISYTGGLSTIPDDLKDAVCMLLQRVWREFKQGTADMVSVNTPTGSVTFADRRLPPRAAQILESYRVLEFA